MVKSLLSKPVLFALLRLDIVYSLKTSRGGVKHFIKGCNFPHSWETLEFDPTTSRLAAKCTGNFPGKVPGL